MNDWEMIDERDICIRRMMWRTNFSGFLGFLMLFFVPVLFSTSMAVFACTINTYTWMNIHEWNLNISLFTSQFQTILGFFSPIRPFFSNLNNFCIHYKLVYIMNEIWTHPCVPLNSSFCPADRALNTSIYIKLSVDLSKNHERNSIIHLVSGWNL